MTLVGGDAAWIREAVAERAKRKWRVCFKGRMVGERYIGVGTPMTANTDGKIFPNQIDIYSVFDTTFLPTG